ncbi:hypothetical protein D3C83_35270 [compost metagenome]
MPPITVVSPSATSTCVLARWVSIGGMPPTARLKSAAELSTTMRMITVLAAVICGVTRSTSAASRNVTVTVLLAIV